MTLGWSRKDIALYMPALVLYWNSRVTSLLECVVNRCLVLICAVYTLVSWYKQSGFTHPLQEYPLSKAAVGKSTSESSNIGSWRTHSVLNSSPGQRNNRVRSPYPWRSNEQVCWKTSLEGEVPNQMLWKNIFDLCFNSASNVKIMTPTCLATMVFDFLVELINGSFTPSVPIRTVLDTVVARWFGG